VKKAIIGVLLAAAVGCGQPGEKPAAASGTPPLTNLVETKSVARQAIEGFTGKTAVDAGQRAKAKIREVSSEKQQDLDAAMSE
jgi:hypothetical protein